MPEYQEKEVQPFRHRDLVSVEYRVRGRAERPSAAAAPVPCDSVARPAVSVEVQGAASPAAGDLERVEHLHLACGDERRMPPFIVGGVGRIDEGLQRRHSLPVRPWGPPAGTRIGSVFHGGSPVAKEGRMPGLPHLVHPADLRDMDILPWFLSVFRVSITNTVQKWGFYL
mgnify:CR=1 FL=1